MRQADVDLRGFRGDGRVAANGGGAWRGLLDLPLPVAEQIVDLLAKRVPIESAGEGEDAAAGHARLSPEVLHIFEAEAFEVIALAERRAVVRLGVVAPPQFEHDALLRFIHERIDRLEAQCPAGLEGVLVEIRLTQHVQQQRQGLLALGADHRRAEAQMVRIDTCTAIDAELVECIGVFTGAQATGATTDHLRQHGGGAELIVALHDEAGRRHAGHGQRLCAGHGFSQQPKTVG